MVEHKYGEFSDGQFEEAKTFLRKQIFALLLYADPALKDKYEGYDINKAFSTLMYKIGGMNSLLKESPALVCILSNLEAALLEYQNPNFNFKVYRRLILEAGSFVLKINEEVV